MQLPRVVIAAVFILIGVLIAVPSLVNWMSEPSSASSPAGGDSTTSGSPSPTGSGASPSKSGSASPRPTRTPAQPLRVSIGSVDCPAREVQVTVRNTGSQAVDYAIEKNDNSQALPGRIGAGATRTSKVELREDRRTRIQVTYRNRPVESEIHTADCKRTEAAPGDDKPGDDKPGDDKPGDDRLPHTGPDDSMLWARVATGGAALITGLIIFWYGGIWPRRRERILAEKNGRG